MLLVEIVVEIRGEMGWMALTATGCVSFDLATQLSLPVTYSPLSPQINDG